MKNFEKLDQEKLIAKDVLKAIRACHFECYIEISQDKEDKTYSIIMLHNSDKNGYYEKRNIITTFKPDKFIPYIEIQEQISLATENDFSSTIFSK